MPPGGKLAKNGFRASLVQTSLASLAPCSSIDEPKPTRCRSSVFNGSSIVCMFLGMFSPTA